MSIRWPDPDEDVRAGERGTPSSWADRLLEQRRSLYGNERGAIPADCFDCMAQDWQPDADPEVSADAVDPAPPEIDGPDIE